MFSKQNNNNNFPKKQMSIKCLENCHLPSKCVVLLIVFQRSFLITHTRSYYPDDMHNSDCQPFKAISTSRKEIDFQSTYNYEHALKF